ncbi:MAG: efflux RND transporter permease subunit, partial [Candidatus Nanoarchaeia archaeon]
YKYLPELRKEAEELLAKIAPGAKIQFFVETGGATSNAPVQLRLIGNDMTKLRMLSHKMQNIISKIQGTSDVADNLGPAKTAISLTIDRETSQFYKISADSIGKQLRHATGNDEIALFPAEDSKEELKIRLGTLWLSRKGAPGGPMTIEEISKIILINDENKPVQLASLLKMEVEQEPLSITHYGGNRTVVVTSETDNRPALEILSDIEKEIRALKEKGEWPAGITYSFGGEIEEMEETYGGIWKIVAIAVFLVFTVLAMQFGNFSQPLIIFTSVPSSLIGVLLGFFFLDISFSFPAAIGVISLTGIAVNDAIVMIETMNRLREGGKSLREASILGGSMRLRPILLTTITTVVGLIPLSLSDPCWMPLCMAIILGISASTIISLFAIPCLYLLLTRETPAG